MTLIQNCRKSWQYFGYLCKMSWDCYCFILFLNVVFPLILVHTKTVDPKTTPRRLRRYLARWWTPSLSSVANLLVWSASILGYKMSVVPELSIICSTFLIHSDFLLSWEIFLWVLQRHLNFLPKWTNRRRTGIRTGLAEVPKSRRQFLRRLPLQGTLLLSSQTGYLNAI